MAILSGQRITAALLRNLKPATYDAAASGTLVLTTSQQDITGASITLTTATAGAVFVATGTFDVNVTTAQASQLAEGHLDVDGVDQTPRALRDTNAISRVTVTRSWRGTLGAAGSHTLKLRGVKTGTTNVVSMVTTHTGLTVVIYEVV